MTNDLMSWLRQTIEGDKLLAEAVKDPAEISMGAEFVDNCGSDEAAEHIRRHDTGDTIARCEAGLLLLDEHHYDDGDCSRCGRASWEENPGGHLRDEPEMVDVWRPAIWPCRTLRLLASAYRRRPGWHPAWAPEGMTP